MTYISKMISTLYRVQNCSRPWEKFLAGKKAMVQWIRPIFAMEFSLGVGTCVDFLHYIGFWSKIESGLVAGPKSYSMNIE